jgi:hypothetical protein
MKNGRSGGRWGASHEGYVTKPHNGCGDSPAGFDCPACDRPTLQATPDEVTDFRCSVCGERVREVNA